jgi:hypothetical protein
LLGWRWLARVSFYASSEGADSAVSAPLLQTTRVYREQTLATEEVLDEESGEWQRSETDREVLREVIHFRLAREGRVYRAQVSE